MVYNLCNPQKIGYNLRKLDMTTENLDFLEPMMIRNYPLLSLFMTRGNVHVPWLIARGCSVPEMIGFRSASKAMRTSRRRLLEGLADISAN
jgi:hypothetical protein